MKAIGPYVVNREVSPVRGSDTLPDATMPISARTLWVTDRLTGMPALLHELPAPMPAPELPRSPSLLPFSDLVVEGTQAYLVTELPLNAVPASDPLLAARAALAALETLHSHVLAHGQLDAGQLWSVDGRVMLVGGGLHRLGQQFSAARDLRDLARTLDDLGGLPPILSLLRNPHDTLSAYEARQLLEAGLQAHPTHSAMPEAPDSRGETPQAAVVPLPDVSAHTAPAPAPQIEQPAPGAASASPTGGRTDARTSRQPSVPALNPMTLLDNSAPLPQQGPYLWQASWTPLDSDGHPTGPAEVPSAAQIESHGASSVTASSTSASGPDASAWASSAGQASETRTASVGAFGEAFQLDISEWTFPEFLDGQATSTPSEPPPPVVVSSTPVVLQWAAPNRRPQAAPETGTAPGADASTAEARDKASVTRPAPESSAEPTFSAPSRRGARAAATRALDRLRADTSRLQNMAEVRRDHLPSQWQAVAEGTVAPLTEPSVAETPQERRRREYEAMREQHEFDVQNAADRQQRLTENMAGSLETEPVPETATVSRRQLKPIKVTWTKDETWRVVHDGEPAGAARGPTATEPGQGAPAWLLPVVAGLVALALLGWLISGLRHRSAVAPQAACCTVEFRLQGQEAPGKTARLTLESAPAGAKLSPGQLVGTAPGQVSLPVKGNYRVRVTTDGFTPASVSFGVPSDQPVLINLGR